MFIKSNNITAQQAQHICTAPIQRRTSVEAAVAAPRQTRGIEPMLV